MVVPVDVFEVAIPTCSAVRPGPRDLMSSVLNTPTTDSAQGVVVGIPGGADRSADIGGGEPFSEGDRGVLPRIGVVYQPRQVPPTALASGPQCLRQGAED